jgi:hypothetical protein
MPVVSFWVTTIFIVVAIAIFSYGLWLLSKRNPKAGGAMNLGFGIGLIGITLFAIIYGFFNI